VATRFPYQPTALAFDPIQRLIAIGTKGGSMRILGRTGVDINVQHVPSCTVIQILFVVNEGLLITVCADGSVHLWNLKQKQPTVLQTLRLQRENVTHCHLPFQSKWLYIGSDRGNVYIANVETFVLSSYVINWNKIIELSRKTHPGCIVHLSECPIDTNKLLIGYDSGIVVMWDLRSKSADTRIAYNEALKSISWHHEGRQFLCSHADGSITTWNIKTTRPASVVYPHARNVMEDLTLEPCRPVSKVEWRTVRNGDSFIIFSGGMPVGDSNSNPGTPSSSATSESKSNEAHTQGTQSLTIIHGKTTTVLEMEHNIIDFVTLCESPWESDFNDPYAVLVLLDNDLVDVDLTTPGFPCTQNPFTVDLHESPITYCAYFSDTCASDLTPSNDSADAKGTTKRSVSEKESPINPEAMGNLYISKEVPGAPRPSFLKGLFSGGPSLLDREELFGETAGKLRPQAKIIPGSPGALESAKSQSQSACGELARVRQGFTERGENLEKLEDKTARMMTESEGFKTTAHQLYIKYRDKKWYQF
ncbi:syntaxin-binding protein 5-like protein, partial [Leptotrombidium deliense]